MNTIIEQHKPINAAIKLVNQLTSDTLKGVDDVKRDSNGSPTDWELNFAHPKINSRWQLWIKQMFILKLGGWDNDVTQTLKGRYSTCKGYHSALIRTGVWASIHYPDVPLSQWTESHVTKLIQDTIENAIPWKKDKEAKPLSTSAPRAVLEMLRVSKTYQLLGQLSDGLSITLPKHFLAEAAEPVVTKYGVDIEDWLKGGTWTAVPLVLAMTMLQRAIAVLRDPYTQFLMAFMTLQRERGFHVNPLTKGSGFSNYCNGDASRKSGQSHKNLEDYRLIKDLLDKHRPEDGEHFSVKQGDISNHCRAVYDACIVIWFTLTGIRVSELVSISADDYEPNPDGTRTFKSKLIKTNQGIAEARELSGLTLEAAETMVALSYITKRHREDGQRLPLFGWYFSEADINNDNNIPKNSRRGIRTYTARKAITSFLDDTLEAHPELRALCEHIHPHMFRHTWAEFALRRFEGNVFEAIRRHFLHAYGSYYTTHYTFNKLSKEVKDSLERRYLQEILTRIATESVEAMNDPNFKRDMTGKVVSYVSRAMDVDVIETAEINDFVGSIADEFESIVAHEYGYCIVRKATRHLAKCYDRETQMPILENGCFALCPDCPNFAASVKSHKEFIVRTAISHQSMIEAQEKLWGKNLKSKAVNASRAAVKQADKILNEMEA